MNESWSNTYNFFLCNMDVDSDVCFNFIIVNAGGIHMMTQL